MHPGSGAWISPKYAHPRALHPPQIYLLPQPAHAPESRLRSRSLCSTSEECQISRNGVSRTFPTVIGRKTQGWTSPSGSMLQ